MDPEIALAAPPGTGPSFKVDSALVVRLLLVYAALVCL